MYAIIQTGGKQVQVELGSKFRVEKIGADVGDNHRFDNVLLVANGEQTMVGTPYVEDSPVVAKVLKHGRGDKIRVIKMKRRKNYRRTQGHRQSFTELEVISIGDSSRRQMLRESSEEQSQAEIEDHAAESTE